MNKQSTCVIATPVYKSFSDLTEGELINLSSSCKCLSKYPHVLFGPISVNWKEYIDFYESFEIAVTIKQFDSNYFKNIDGYNKLLKTVSFYEQFKYYRFLLIFQTDAYVFKDELEYWCSLQYDYIGAPWFKEEGSGLIVNEFGGVGNGGFSLRNVRSTINILKRFKALFAIRNFWFRSGLQSVLTFDDMILRFKNVLKFREGVCLNDILIYPYINEDYLLSQTLAKMFSDYNVAPIDKAISFSFETNPSFLYKKNKNRLPFGCHAWEKNEPQFWKSKIH